MSAGRSKPRPKSCAAACPARQHRFDLAQIKDMLSEVCLSFDGFYVPAEMLTKYRSMFRDDRNATNLDCWKQFEARYPETFASM